MRLRITFLACLLTAASFGQVVHVWLPDTIKGGPVGDTIEVPILISDQVGKGVIAVDMALGFDVSGLLGTTGYRLGSSAPGWMVYTNPFPCSLLIAMAGADPLIAGDTLLVVKMKLNTTDTTRVRIARCRLNEGQVPCSIGPGGGLVDVEELPRLEPSGRLVVCPNPARSRVMFRIEYCGSASAMLEIYDQAGGILRTLTGREPQWDCRDESGRRLPAGVYFCRLVAAEFRDTRKVLLVE